MSLESLISRPCTIVKRRPGSERDEFNNPVVVETETPAYCYLEQIGAWEDTENRDEQAGDWKIWLLPTTLDIAGSDQVVIDDVAYEIRGRVGPWLNPRTQQFSHIECFARRVD